MCLLNKIVYAEESFLRSDGQETTEVSLLWVSIALIIEAASTSETSVKFYQITRRNNPEDSHLHYRVQINLPLDYYHEIFARFV
jgi:hypothetical protein